MGRDIKEITGMLIVLILIVTVVQWFSIEFTHWSVALIITGLISLVIWSLYASLKYMSPNGGSYHGSRSWKLDMPTLAILASFLSGGLTMVCYLTKNDLPKMVIVLPLSFVVVFAIGRYVYQYIKNVNRYHELFSHCDIEALNETSKSNVREMSFHASSGLCTSIEPNSDKPPYPRLTRNASKIIFHCYTKTKGMSRQSFPFDYRLCQEKEGKRLGLCFWLRQKVVLPMKIVLQPGDKVDLYLGGNLVQQYQLIDEDLPKKVKQKGK
jgi:hypothetical protein